MKNESSCYFKSWKKKIIFKIYKILILKTISVFILIHIPPLFGKWFKDFNLRIKIFEENIKIK